MQIFSFEKGTAHKNMVFTYGHWAFKGHESGVVVAGDTNESQGGGEIGGRVDIAGGEDALEIINLSCHIWQWVIFSLKHSCSSVRIIHPVQ